jgi:hypothetical protein
VMLPPSLVCATADTVPASTATATISAVFIGPGPQVFSRSDHFLQ